VIPISSHRVRSILPLAAFLAALAIGTAGCESAAIPAAATIVQGGVAAAGYSAIRAGEKSADKHTPGSLDDQEERCEALVGSAPDVEEVRKNKYDIIEVRQWRLVDPSNPHWMIVQGKQAPADGWEPKPRINKLGFSPPLADQLDYGESQFLAYAPNNLDSIEDSRAMTSVTEAFGQPVGTFQWRGKTYGYTLVPQLPCFPVRK